jgi:hypothetical protein
VIRILLGVTVVCGDGHIAILGIVILSAYDCDALPDEKDGDPTKGKGHDADDGNTVLGCTALFRADIEKSHLRVDFFE